MKALQNVPERRDLQSVLTHAQRRHVHLRETGVVGATVELLLHTARLRGLVLHQVDHGRRASQDVGAAAVEIVEYGLLLLYLLEEDNWEGVAHEENDAQDEAALDADDEDSEWDEEWEEGTKEKNHEHTPPAQ